MQANEIRKRFSDFFIKNQHAKIQSSSIIPENDPTLLFANAGMNQFKDYFTGKDNAKNPRAITFQKCVRAGGKHNDLENVGLTARHHTFFEMLGNFSFGDYFKKEAIQFAWEFLTKELKIPAEKLFITVHTSDDEAEKIWLEDIGISQDKIFKKGDKDNFWEMGELGPCGPCSEIFYDHGIEHATPNFTPDKDQDLLDDEMRYVEIWNLVFMQYEKLPDGTRTKLPKPSIDTGAGLERLAAIMQGKYWNYDTDLFAPILRQLEKLSKKDYTQEPYTTSMRIIADHIRAATMLITDGIIPSNEGRGYVLRRIIRRAVRHLKNIGCEPGVLAQLVPVVFDILGDEYAQNRNNQSLAEKFLQLEEQKFLETLDLGLSFLEDSIKKDLKNNILPGESAFKLYDTYGFPVDLTEIILEEKGFKLDKDGFAETMRKRKEESRKSWKGGLAANNEIFFAAKEKNGPTLFKGYEQTKLKSKLLDIIDLGESKGLIFSETPFYGESGGQAGDIGVIKQDGAILAQIRDTQKPVEQLYVHLSQTADLLKVGQIYELEIDEEKRNLTMRNHSATHLLQSALIEVLGDHIKQAGSLVNSEKLRFDFTHLQSLSEKEVEVVEEKVNLAIKNQLLVAATEMTKDQAIAKGAQALFGEKYGDTVRVLEMGEYSIELCGGTHISNTRDIGFFKVLSEQSLSTGVRRIEAITSSTAFNYLNHRSKLFNQLEKRLKDKDLGVLQKVEGLFKENKEKQKTIRELEDKINSSQVQDLFSSPEILKDNISFKEVLAPKGADLKKLSDLFLDKNPDGIVLLYDNSGEKLSVLLKTSKKAIINCSKNLKDTLPIINGRGGGRPDMAQGSGENNNLEAFLASVKEKIKESL